VAVSPHERSGHAAPWRRDLAGAALLVVLGVGLRLAFLRAFPTLPLSDFRALIDFGIRLRDRGLAAPGWGWVQFNPGLPLILSVLLRAFPSDPASAARIATAAVTGRDRPRSVPPVAARARLPRAALRRACCSRSGPGRSSSRASSRRRTGRSCRPSRWRASACAASAAPTSRRTRSPPDFSTRPRPGSARRCSSSSCRSSSPRRERGPRAGCGSAGSRSWRSPPAFRSCSSRPSAGPRAAASR
jgi:hypothetical protein